MVVAHLLVGFLAGALAAVTSLVMGYSFRSAVGFYILGGSLGVAGSLALWLLGRLTKTAKGTSSGVVTTESDFRQAS
jgi:hypothetical protein